MKPAVKLGSLMLAVLMMFTIIASGCSVNKEFSYKTDTQELAIGVYIYELSEAYAQAQKYAEKLEGYDPTSDSWLDMEITDDDGNTAVARQWIKDKAEQYCLEMLALENELQKLGATVDSALLEQYKTQSQSYWDFGVPDAMYLQYGYGYNPMKTAMEGFGISYESFEYANSNYNAMKSKLFEVLYLDGGSKAPAEDEVTKYFEENYVRYSYLPIALYTSTTDEAGEATNVAMSDDEVKKITKEYESYAKAVNKAAKQATANKTFEDQINAYLKANDLTENSPLVTNTAIRNETNIGEEIDKAIAELDECKATTVQVGKGETAMFYYVYRYDMQSAKDNYLTDDNKDNIIYKMKETDFNDYLKGLIAELKYEKGGAVDGYDPKMFFVAKEPETTPATDTQE